MSQIYRMLGDEPPRCLVADDEPRLRQVLCRLMHTDGFECLEAGNGVEALAVVEQVRPDVVVMDLHMPELNGVEATRAITAAHPGVSVLVLTVLENDESVFSAVRAGAKG